ncbi:hypothetical protein HWV62_40435 [Athelia sp. TMB]|nr:hypothetical protein HWV62_40435 [Athelia sp. TMB]
MASPSRPLNITSPRLAARDFTPDAAGSFASGTPLSGTPDLRALRAQYAYSGTPPVGNIPPRPGTGTPSTPIQNRSGTPQLIQGQSRGFSNSNVSLPGVSASPRVGPSGLGGISAHRPSTPDSRSGSPFPTNLEDLPDEEKAKVLRRHLVSKEERTPASRTSSASLRSAQTATARREDSEPFPVPYDSPGADVTHDIYKWQTDQRRAAMRQRAVSYSVPAAPADPVFEHIHEPGGFRRNYVLLRAGEDEDREPPRMLNNFIDFLFIFGHFAGEDLEEDDEDYKEEDEEEALSPPDPSSSLLPTGLSGESNERAPLLGSTGRARSHSRRRRMSTAGQHGDATMTQAVLMLLKAFVGTGVLFMGKAFYNGGILFSSGLLAFICAISLYSFLLLVKAKFVVSGSFGDIGGALYGPWMRYCILTSIAVSQIGFVAAYTIFVSQNLQAFVSAVTDCVRIISLKYFILMQIVVLVPLALVRNLAKLSVTALIADAFILAGLIYVFGSEAAVLARQGPADVALFNAKDFPLFVGTAVFAFEGIGLVIPITDAMREPHRFPVALTGVMGVLLVIFGGAGAMSYLAFGAEIQTVVLVNLDTASRLTQAVQFLYSLAILLSTPLQLFPAVRIMENGLFKRSGKADTRVKWLKNLFRTATVLLCGLIAWLGAADLDKFVAFIGSFACIPLCYIYPAMLHYRACAKTRREKLADIALMVFGLIAATYTTIQTVRLMMEPEAGGPTLGKCDAPVPSGP